MEPTRADPLPRRSHRIVLRRLAPADLGRFQAYRRDPQVGLYQGWEPQPDAEAMRFIREMRDIALFPRARWVQLAIAHRPTDTLIGDVGICVSASGDIADIGFSLSAAAQGQGYGTEAVLQAIALVFDHSPVNQVMAVTDTRNTRSVRLLERVGMRRLETIAAVFRGAACTEHVYAIARADRLPRSPAARRR